jgi:O-succinylbenzoic acid--CoA ligase
MTPDRSETDWLAAAAAKVPDAIALVGDGGAAVTYRELDALASSASHRLHTMFDLVPTATMGFAPRHARPDLVAALWGAWRLGVAALIVNPDLVARFHDQPRWGWAGDVPAYLTGLDLEPGLAGPRGVPSPEQLHTVMLTSGSRGAPRGVRLTHGNVAAAVTASSRRIGNAARDRWLLTLPLFHVGGLSILWRAAAAGGAVVVHDRFDPHRAAAAMRDGSVTIASLVPTMLYRILEVDPGPYSGMRAVLLGGAAADRALVARGLDAGLPILQTYGTTETCSQVATVAPGEAREALGTAGRPLDGLVVTIVEGEIVVDGPAVSPGYLGEPDRCRGHHTGDRGHLDAAGRLVVSGRGDEMIVTGGENVSPDRVAAVLNREGRGRIEVVGATDAEWGQVVVAVVAGPSELMPELERLARAGLARHEVPKRWVFVEALPLLANGKVDRLAVQRMAENTE